MATTKTHKKNLIVSYKNLPDDLKEKFKEAYPEGYSDYITRFTKPNGDAIFVVPFDTPDTAYMVKFDVKIDSLGQDLDKALFDDDEPEGKDEEFAPLSEAMEKEEVDTSHRERHLRHGDFEDIFDDEAKKKKASLGVDKEGLKAAFGDDEDADEMPSSDNRPASGQKANATTATKGGGKTPVTDKFSTDLTQAALEGKLDPVVGREREIQRVIEVLCRRKKNNPILIGEPGVGKSDAYGHDLRAAQRKDKKRGHMF